MEKIGTFLKQLREANGLSIDDVNNITRIRTDYLEDIESNRFQILHDYGIARAVVFNYGKALKANEKEILYTFDNTYPHSNNHNFKPQENIKENKILISFNLLYIIGISILVIIIAFSLARLYQKGSLGSPFKKRFVNIEKPAPPPANSDTENEETPEDTQRELMKKLKESQETETPQKEVSLSDALADDNDYASELIFKDKNSVLNTD